MDYNYWAFFKQLLGQKNLFGYSKKILNQAHMMYWFLGEFHFSKVFNRYITRFWIIFNIYSLIALNTHCLLYIFVTTKPQMIFILFATEILITSFYLLVMTPLGAYWYNGCIRETFKIFDKSFDLELRSVSKLSFRYCPQIEPVVRKKYTLKIPLTILEIQTFIFFAYILGTYLDLAIGYSTEKLSDPKYSVFPLYCENVDRLSTFSMLLFTQMITGITMGTIYFSLPFFPFVLAREFYNKFQDISDFLDYRSKLFEYYYEELAHKKYHGYNDVSDLQDAFIKDVHSVARYHHNLLKGAAHLRPYLEYNMTIGLFVISYIEVVLIYIFTLMHEDAVLLKFKISCHALITGAILFMYCLSGKLYSDMCDMFNESVYNIPWYYLPPSSRKSVHLLLNQAQVTIIFRAFRIFNLNMEFFLRISNNIYSTVNLLRRNAVGFGF